MSTSAPAEPGFRRASPARGQGGWWARLSPLGREITIVLAIKFAALALLWWAFFSHPAAPHMSVEIVRIDAPLSPPASAEESARAIR